MKIKIIVLVFICNFFANALFSQSGEGNTLKVNINKRKPVIEWLIPVDNDTIVNSLTTQILAGIKCEDLITSVELFINGSIQRGFEPVKSGNGYLVKIDKTITLKDGQNTIYILARSTKETTCSETRTIIGQKPANKPNISWISPIDLEINQKTSIIQIKACIKSETPLKGVEVHVNDSLLNGSNIVESFESGCNVMIDKKINLKAGANTIYIIASNKGGSGTSEIISVNYNDGTIIQKRVALIIGNSVYKNAGILKNPKNDASDISAALKRLNFDIELVSDADYNNLGMAIDRFGERTKNADISFFYYAGHGVQVNGSNYLIPVDVDIKDENQVKYSCHDANRVLAYMESAQSKVNIIVMDACRDNPFERSWKRSINGRGLASMDAPVGSIVAYSTQPGNTAADGSGKNGLYTSALLEYIEKPGISLNEIFMKVRVKVLQESGKQQQPWESSSLTQNVYLLK